MRVIVLIFLFIVGDKLFPFQHLTEMHLECLQALLCYTIVASLLKTSVLVFSSVVGKTKKYYELLPQH